MCGGCHAHSCPIALRCLSMTLCTLRLRIREAQREDAASSRPRLPDVPAPHTCPLTLTLSPLYSCPDLLLGNRFQGSFQLLSDNCFPDGPCTPSSGAFCFQWFPTCPLSQHPRPTSLYPGPSRRLSLCTLSTSLVQWVPQSSLLFGSHVVVPGWRALNAPTSGAQQPEKAWVQRPARIQASALLLSRCTLACIGNGR